MQRTLLGLFVLMVGFTVDVCASNDGSVQIETVQVSRQRERSQTRIFVPRNPTAAEVYENWDFFREEIPDTLRDKVRSEESLASTTQVTGPVQILPAPMQVLISRGESHQREDQTFNRILADESDLTGETFPRAPLWPPINYDDAFYIVLLEKILEDLKYLFTVL